MRLGTIAFLLGVIVCHVLPALPGRAWAAWLALAVVLIRYAPRLRLVAWALAGFLWSLLWAGSATGVQLPAELESVDLRLDGWVASIPEWTARGARFQLQVKGLWRGEARIPFAGRVQLAWSAAPPSLRVGDEWRLAVRLRRPRGWANPGGFDAERWLFVQGIAARGYVRDAPAPRLLDPAARYPVDRFRQALAERFARLLGGNPHVGVLTALAVGERQGIGAAQWEVFARTGTAHLIAISGLHVGLVAGLAFVLARWGWTRWPALVRRWPAAKAAAVASLLAAAGYALLAGMSLPTRRALLMIAVAVLALLGQRRVAPSRILALALLAVLLADPTAPLAGGFWLSFAAVAVILYRLAGRLGPYRLSTDWMGLQLAITLALLPVTLILFQSVSLISPLANLIAIPWVSLTVVPLTLLAVLAGGVSETMQSGLLTLAAFAMDLVWPFLDWLARSPWAMVYRPSPPLWTLVLAIPGLALLLAPRGLPGRWLGAALCLPLLCPPAAAPAPGAVWFTLLEVGQGLAVVVRTARHVLVYDTGPRLGGLDAGRAALVPFLRQQGVDRIDTLIVSHADNAHMGGTRSLLEAIGADRILTSSRREVPIEGAGVCRAGMAWRWDGVDFRLLHPPEGAGFAGDEASCVLLVEGRGGRLLLPGDIGPRAEAALLQSQGPTLAAEILVAPHHGTRSLSLPAFVAAVRPRYVLFSTAYRNRFGYPRPETVERYSEGGATLLDTARHGAISFRLEEGVPLRPEPYRQQVRRHWSAR